MVWPQVKTKTFYAKGHLKNQRHVSVFQCAQGYINNCCAYEQFCLHIISPFSPLLSQAVSVFSPTFLIKILKTTFSSPSLYRLSISTQSWPRCSAPLSNPQCPVLLQQKVLSPLRGLKGPHVGSLQTHPCPSPQGHCPPTTSLGFSFPKQPSNTQVFFKHICAFSHTLWMPFPFLCLVKEFWSCLASLNCHTDTLGKISCNRDTQDVRVPPCDPNWITECELWLWGKRHITVSHGEVSAHPTLSD